MVGTSNPRTHARLPWFALGALTVLVTAGLAPMAAAQPEERRAAHRPGHSFELALAGTAVDKDGNVYTIEIAGEGKYRRHETDDNLSVIRAHGRFEVKLLDANGTVIKDGHIFAKIRARETADGVWTWGMAGFGRRDAALPALILRGDGVQLEDESVSLTGHGKAATKLPDDRERTVFRLDVAGTVSKA